MTRREGAPRRRIEIRVAPPRLLPLTPEQRARAVSVLADLLYEDYTNRVNHEDKASA